MIWIFYITLFLAGSIFGSFLNALIWRSRERMSLVNGRSRCVHCLTIIRPTDLVPLLSFCVLRGKCRDCEKNISFQYPIVEFLMGLLFVFFAIVHSLDFFQLHLEYIRDILIAMCLLFIFIYDLQYMEILDRATTIPAGILFVISLLFGWQTFGSMLAGAIVGVGFFLIQFVLSKGTWIGGGDIRMGLFMGVVLGWSTILIGLFLSYIFGAFAGVLLLTSRKKEPGAKIPFGVYLSVGTLVAMVWGADIIQWYMSLL